MCKYLAALGVLTVLGSFAGAAIIYEPVQSQYRDPKFDRPAFYYGGSNPLVLERARNVQQRFNLGIDSRNGVTLNEQRQGGPGFNLVHTGLIEMPKLVYSDLLPPGVNAYPYGVSEADAQYQANLSGGLYFRKADLHGYLAADGSIIVPAHQPHHMHPIRDERSAATQPAQTTQPTPILIIPKRLLNKPLNSGAAPVASANQ